MNRALAIAATFRGTCVRRFSETAAKCGKYEGPYSALKKKQAHFQVDNDVPIYLKGGPLDYVLYYGTLALVVVGVAVATHSTYKLATKK